MRAGTWAHGRLPSVEECRAALDRVLASPAFRTSPKLSAFLRLVVDATLAGQADRIKGYTIGVEALGRGPDFDPQSDPIVRVEARRLRRTLESYYASAQDPVVIALPLGTYVPTFTVHYAARPASPAGDVVAPRTAWWRRPAPLAAIATATGAVAIFGIVHVGVMNLRSHMDVAGAVPARPSSRSGVGPSIYIAPVVTVGAPVAPTITAAALRNRLIDGFARFDDVNVLTQPAPPQNAGAAYELGVTIEHQEDGGGSVTFRLVDAVDSVVAWSKTYDSLPVAEERKTNKYPMVAQVATTLFHPFGIIQTRERSKLAVGGDVDPRYACVLVSNELWRSFDPAQYAGVRGCLDRAIAADPAFAGGFALLARLNLRDFQFGYGGGSGDPATLDRALALAHRAIELKPESARSHYILLEILTARGAVAEGLAEGETALGLNPFDLTALYHYGAALVRAGNIAEGLEHLRRVDSGGVIRQQQLGFLLFVAAYLHGDNAAAGRYAERITSDKYTLGFLARALAAHKAGEQDRARQALGRLVALQPAWRDDPREELRKFFTSSDIVERLTGDLAALSPGGAGADVTGSIEAPRKRD